MFEFQIIFNLAGHRRCGHVIVSWNSPRGKLYANNRTKGTTKDEIMKVAFHGVLDMIARAYGNNYGENERGWKNVYWAHQHQIRRNLIKAVEELDGGDII